MKITSKHSVYEVPTSNPWRVPQSLPSLQHIIAGWVFENFRSICLNYYVLDSAHYYTSPGLACSACLKMADVELELLTNLDTYWFVKEGICSGIFICGSISMISNQAISIWLSLYKNKDKNYIILLGRQQFVWMGNDSASPKARLFLVDGAWNWGAECDGHTQ